MPCRVLAGVPVGLRLACKLLARPANTAVVESCLGHTSHPLPWARGRCGLVLLAALGLAVPCRDFPSSPDKALARGEDGDCAVAAGGPGQLVIASLYE